MIAYTVLEYIGGPRDGERVPFEVTEHLENLPREIRFALSSPCSLSYPVDSIDAASAGPTVRIGSYSLRPCGRVQVVYVTIEMLKYARMTEREMVLYCFEMHRLRTAEYEWQGE